MLPRKAWERLPDWLERRECRRPALGHHEVRLRKAVLMLSTITLLALIWVARYAVLGLWIPAAIPLAYQLNADRDRKIGAGHTVL